MTTTTAALDGGFWSALQRGFRPSVLGGGEPAVLNKVGGKERRKYAAMGFVLLSTSVMGGISAAFAMRMALKAPLAGAVVLGVVWGLVILNLDRMLVLTMGTERSLRRNIALAIPRVLLAAVIGTVIATPITLATFGKEIASEVQVMQADDNAAFEAQLANDPGFKTIPVLQQQIASLQTVVIQGGQVDVDADPSVQAALTDQAAKQAVYNQQLAQFLTLQHAAQCEGDGTCGTGVPGFYGEAAKRATAAANAQKAVADAANADLQASTSALASARQKVAAQAPARLADAKTSLAAAQTGLAAQQKREDALIKAHQQQVADSDGLLYRLEALSQLSKQHGVVGRAHWLLWALFTCIELLPVLAKVLMNIGKQTAYEKEAERQDEQTAEVNRLEGDLETFGARNLAEQQEGLVEAVNTTVVAQQKTVVEAALARWAEHAARQSQRQLDEYEATLSGTSAQPPGPVPLVTSTGPTGPVPPTGADPANGAVTANGAGPITGPGRGNGARRTGGRHSTNGHESVQRRWQLPIEAP